MLINWLIAICLPTLGHTIHLQFAIENPIWQFEDDNAFTTETPKVFLFQYIFCNPRGKFQRLEILPFRRWDGVRNSRINIPSIFANWMYWQSSHKKFNLAYYSCIWRTFKLVLAILLFLVAFSLKWPLILQYLKELSHDQTCFSLNEQTMFLYTSFKNNFSKFDF
jgi:hypothetical protein